MGRNRVYWKYKNEMSSKAEEHTLAMEKMFQSDISESVKGTVEYGPAFRCRKNVPVKKNHVMISEADSVEAVFRYADREYGLGKCAVLNFASYRNPGGRFLEGSTAQEECLCHSSFLYNVLCRMKDYYAWNNSNVNRNLYKDRALYSPKIRFESGMACRYCDVITCAAPNRTAARKYQGVSDSENIQALESRIRFVLDIAKENNVKTLILGAFGCGVFGQDASVVSGIFKRYAEGEFLCFDEIIFAIPKGKDGNYNAFASEFSSWQASGQRG